MKLYLNKASPYARLVLVVAHEKSISDQLELVWTDPWASEERLLDVNPFSKVPALALDSDGNETLIESACICDYLDDIGGGRRLLPHLPAVRKSALVKYGRGRALIDSAFGAVIQRRFTPAGVAESPLVERWLAAVARAAPILEQGAAELRSHEPDIGDLAVAVGLSYVDFRLSEIKWRAPAPAVAKWLDEISKRPSMLETAPS
jgi:glutathione S-transferase